MAESQSVEEKVINAFMGDLTPQSDTQQANPETEAPEQAETEAPQAEKSEADKEAKAESSDDVQTIEIDPDEPLFEQEIEEDGKKVPQKLSLKELQQGYLRQRDYTKKTQELARQREELPKHIAKQSQELSSSYEKRLSELQGLVVKTVAAELADKDLNKLATEDPFEYVRVSNRARQLNELLQEIRKEQEGETSKRKEEEQKTARQKWSESLEILKRDIPDFGEPVVKRLLAAGEEWGFSKDEVAGWTDHRVIKMLHALTDKKAVETKRPEVEKKVAVVTKTLKPGQPPKNVSKMQEAKAKLRKSGKPEDALAIFEASM